MFHMSSNSTNQYKMLIHCKTSCSDTIVPLMIVILFSVSLIQNVAHSMFYSTVIPSVAQWHEHAALARGCYH